MAKEPKAAGAQGADAEPKRRPAGKLPAAPGTHGLNELSTLLEITPQWFTTLVRRNYIPREDKGRYNLVAAVRGYIRYLKDEDRKSTKTAAQSKVSEARAAEIAQRMAKDSRTLIEFAEAQAVLEDIVGIYRSAYAGLPAACTRDLALRSTIEAQVDETQARVAKELRQRLAALRSGGDALEAADEDDA